MKRQIFDVRHLNLISVKIKRPQNILITNVVMSLSETCVEILTSRKYFLGKVEKLVIVEETDLHIRKAKRRAHF